MLYPTGCRLHWTLHHHRLEPAHRIPWINCEPFADNLGPPGAPSIGQSYSGDHVGIDNDLPIPMRSMTLNFADVFQIIVRVAVFEASQRANLLGY